MNITKSFTTRKTQLRFLCILAILISLFFFWNTSLFIRIVGLKSICIWPYLSNPLKVYSGQPYNCRKFIDKRIREYAPLSENDLQQLFSKDFLYNDNEDIIPDRMNVACYVSSYIQIHDKEIIETIMRYAEASNNPQYLDAFRSVGSSVYPVLINQMHNNSNIEIRAKIISLFGKGETNPNYSPYWSEKARTEIESILLKEETRYVKSQCLRVLENIHNSKSLATIEQYVFNNVESLDAQNNKLFFHQDLYDIWYYLTLWGNDASFSLILSLIEQNVFPTLSDGEELYLPDPHPLYEVLFSEELNKSCCIYRPTIVFQETYSRYLKLKSDEKNCQEVRLWLDEITPLIVLCPDEKKQLPLIRYSQCISYFFWDNEHIRDKIYSFCYF